MTLLEDWYSNLFCFVQKLFKFSVWVVCSLLLEVADPSVSKVLHSVGIQWESLSFSWVNCFRICPNVITSHSLPSLQFWRDHNSLPRSLPDSSRTMQMLIVYEGVVPRNASCSRNPELCLRRTNIRSKIRLERKGLIVSGNFPNVADGRA